MVNNLVSGFFHDTASAFFLARQSVRSSYRRTFLGPIWISINQMLLVSGAGLLFAVILHKPIGAHLAHVALGISIWGYVASMVRISVTVLPRALANTRSGVRPPWFYVVTEVTEQVLIASHTLVASTFAAWILSGIHVGLNLAWAVLLLLLVPINGLGLSLWLGPLSARFRDIPTAVNAALGMIGFVVPTFWARQDLDDAQWIIDANPFAWPIEVIRELLMFGNFEPILVLQFLSISALNLIIGVFSYRANLHRLGLWA